MRKRKPDTRQLYRTARWRHRVRKQVLHDRGYRCAHCKRDLRDAGKLAQVHHIIPLERAPHRGFDLGNLEPLCIDCHNKTHGRGTYHGVRIDGSPADPQHPWNVAARGGTS
jgi:5-methylcytosine-specific restriction endonuclease McrA